MKTLAIYGHRFAMIHLEFTWFSLVNPSQSPALLSVPQIHIYSLMHPPLFNEHHFTSRIASKCAQCNLQSPLCKVWKWKRESPFLPKTFIEFYLGFGKRRNNLNLCSQACQNIIFKFQNSKDNEEQKFKFIGKLSYGCINVEDMGNASRRPPSTFTWQWTNGN